MSSKTHCNTFMLRTGKVYTCPVCGEQEEGEIPVTDSHHQACLRSVSEHYESVKEVMQKANQRTPDKPTIPDEKTRLLRAKLILEEALETIEALGFGVTQIPSETTQDEWDFHVTKSIDLQQIIDGCCDLKVVTTGTLISCGIPDDYVQKMVDENNLEKSRNWTIRDDGKFIKHPDHQPPDIAGFLEDLRYGEQ